MTPEAVVDNPKLAAQLAAALHWEKTNLSPLAVWDGSSFTTLPDSVPGYLRFGTQTAMYTYGVARGSARNYQAMLGISELTDAERMDPIVVQKVFYSQYSGLGSQNSIAIFQAGRLLGLYRSSIYEGTPISAAGLGGCADIQNYNAAMRR